ncbi:MAG: hypothetical protein PHV16_04370 [Candidatus Nanoarchaeia archaeon]|nr:hypothetical protein [Candidatus Nanoarchaeia archaeon]
MDSYPDLYGEYNSFKLIISHLISALLLFLVVDWYIKSILKIENFYFFLTDIIVFMGYIFIYALITSFFSRVIIYPILKNKTFQRYEVILIPLIIILLIILVSIRFGFFDDLILLIRIS